MNRTFKISGITLGLISLIWFVIRIVPISQAQDINLEIHLSGVYESDISLSPLIDGKVLQAIGTKNHIKIGSSANLLVKKEYLPGEFVLRFNYTEKPGSKPNSSEKLVFIASQNIQLWLNPIHANNPDSIRYQDGEKENKVYAEFSKENARHKNMLGVLRNFLLNYDDRGSNVYREGIKEYEKRHKSHSDWIKSQKKVHNALFVSSLFGFEYIPEIDWSASNESHMQNLTDRYFDQVDFNDTLLLKTSELRNFTDQFVNLHAELITSNTMRDSMLTLAGKRAIEKAKKGHPKLYGWMVDYFFEGYERYNIQAGVSMLEPYISDPNCLTAKMQAIKKRLKGMETLLPGTIAPDFEFTDINGNKVKFSTYQSEKPFKLILFWSADCEHCKELVSQLYPWYQQQQDIIANLDVIAISLDETATEVPKWEEARIALPEWIHYRAESGINSKVAEDYFILATPVMVLVNAKTNEIVTLPESIKQIEQAMH
ncbi:TlpA family protein disulfide reductase [Bacteroidota bacterium]